MRFYEDMNDKSGFNDGDAMPEEAYQCREIYIKAINAVAERLGSKVRKVAYDRPGCHNSCLIVTISVDTLREHGVDFNSLHDPNTSDRLSATIPKDSFDVENDDKMWEAIAECEEEGIDDYIEVKVSVAPEFDNFLRNLQTPPSQRGSGLSEAEEAALKKFFAKDEKLNPDDRELLKKHIKPEALESHE